MLHVWGEEKRYVESFGGKRPLGRPRSRWKDNIKMDFQEVGWSMYWNDLARYRDRWRTLVKGVMNLQVP